MFRSQLEFPRVNQLQIGARGSSHDSSFTEIVGAWCKLRRSSSALILSGPMTTVPPVASSPKLGKRFVGTHQRALTSGSHPATGHQHCQSLITALKPPSLNERSTLSTNTLLSLKFNHLLQVFLLNQIIIDEHKFCSTVK